MNQSFMSAMEVAEELGVSKAYAYKVIRELNEELRNKGFQTVSGRINRIYFKERFYLAGKEMKNDIFGFNLADDQLPESRDCCSIVSQL